MTQFLSLVASDILSRTGNNFSDCCIVFPTQRAMLYFNKYVGELINTPVWTPKYFTINNFIAQLSSIQKAHDITLLFELYNLYNKHTKLNESFEEFYFWGELMLSDFDDIDKYLVDTNLLFQNLQAIKSIDEKFSYLTPEQIEVIQQFWNAFNPEKTSAEQQNFINIWNALNPIYTDFTASLKSKGIGYEGLICKDVALNLERGNINMPEFFKTIFIGFNALNQCETKIFKNIQAKGNALFYWDYDHYYLNNNLHEAAFFVRNNMALFPNALPVGCFNNFNCHKQIKVISVPSNIGQTKLAAQLAANYNNYNNTAIILTDEQLLMPLLQGIPANVNDLNVTMGFPVKNSVIANLVEILFRVLKNARKTASSMVTLYYKDVLMLASHPYINRIEPNISLSLNESVIKKNIIWFKISDLPNNSLVQHICNSLTTQTNTAELLNKLLFTIFNSYKNKPIDTLVAIERESLFVVYNAINKLNETINIKGENNIKLTPSLYYKLVRKVINGLTIPFEGEPLQGLQIMGFLESRTLDFENIVMFPLNEGIMPKTNLPASFIPYSLRKAYALPTIEYRDAMYSYYFYRIIQRAQNITFIYNSQPLNGKDEYSRFILQLLYEGGHKVEFITQTFTIAPNTIKNIVIDKDEKVVSVMDKWIGSNNINQYLSPTAITTYIECPLRFYFKHIEKIKEPDTPIEEIDAPMLGKIIHSSLENIYLNYKNKELTKNDIQIIIENQNYIESAILKAFSLNYFKGIDIISINELVGINAIVYKVVLKYIKQVLIIDAQNAPITILEMELPVLKLWPVTFNKQQVEIKIGGIIDRIDQIGNIKRVVDYKTGNAQLQFNNIEQLFKSNNKINISNSLQTNDNENVLAVSNNHNLKNTDEKNKKEIFQLLLYCILLQSQYPSVVPAIYKLRNVFSKTFDAYIKFNNHPLQDISIIETDFVENLSNLLNEIFNTAVPFTQTNNIKNCKNCVYNKICQRN